MAMEKKYEERTLTDTLSRLSNSFKAVLITGPRQVGKTTFLRNVAEANRKYVTLDNPQDLELAKTEPKLFFEKYSPPVLIDEIQYAPELFVHMKMILDNSDQPGRIWMTGSQQYDMMGGVTESLAGRVVILDMLGFSIYERDGKGWQQKPFLPSKAPASILERRSAPETFRIIWQGSFPDVGGMEGKERAGFYNSYVRTYLERDVRQLVNVGDEVAFMKFLRIIAARTAQELNLSDIAKDVDISPNTAKKWLSILETSGLVFLLQPYFKNITKRFIKTPKLYFMDTGLAAHLAGWTTPEALEEGASSGAFFETFVLSEIVKSYRHSGESPQLYYFRDSKKNEIDLLIHQNGVYHPAEIKKTTQPKAADVDAFKIFSKIEKLGYGTLICLTDEPRPLTNEISAISPWDI
jgi:predicted AAA+ superfamily ATPase